MIIRYSSSPNDSAILENRSYDSKYCRPRGVITNVCLPSYSIFVTKPAPVRLSRNFPSLECERFALVNNEVVPIPFIPESWVTVSRSAIICILVLYVAITRYITYILI